MPRLVRHLFALCLAASLLLPFMAGGGCGKQNDVTVELVVPKGYTGHLVLFETPSAPPLQRAGKNRYQVTFDADGSAACADYVQGWHKQVARWSDGSQLRGNAPDGVALHDLGSIVIDGGHRGVIWYVGYYADVGGARDGAGETFRQRFGQWYHPPAATTSAPARGGARNVGRRRRRHLLSRARGWRHRGGGSVE